MAKYDIFISYRRDGGYDTAKHLFDLLTRDGYRVSFDIDTLRNGDFDTSLLKRIDECKDFILIVNPHAFDRTLDPNFNPSHDWLRQELAYALKNNKNIIPVFLNGVTGFPNNLPVDIKQVAKKNGPEYNRYYFNNFYDTLKDRFLVSKSTRHSRSIILITFFIFIGILLGIFVYNIFFADNQNDQVEKEDSYLQTEEMDMRTKLQKFCGSFSYVVPNAGYGGINYVYDLVLDPIGSKVSIIEEGIVNITKSKGYFGTMMQWPEYWNVIDFSLEKDGKDAIVQLIGGDNDICEIKLSLDEYHNIEMSYLNGNQAPSVLMDEKGGYTNTIVFKRDK